MNQVVDFLNRFGVWVTFLTLFLSGVLSPFGLDTLAGAYAFLGAAFISALARWKVWSIPPKYGKWRLLLFKGVTFLLIIACAIGWGYFLWWASQPHFEITAFDTLDGDKNAYELTDMLIWNQDNLDEYGVGITFTLEIAPIYYGQQKFGEVIALISGDDGNPPLEKLSWGSFTKDSIPQKIQLTLPELLGASGLSTNSYPPSNPFRPGDLPFQQARLIVQIARRADKGNPWDSEEITIRNAPWEQRSELVRHNNRREVHVYVRNLGGPGGFTVRYRLVRLEEVLDPSNPHPMLSGTTPVDTWNEPGQLVRLERGEFFTDTVQPPSGLTPGRYLLEAYAVKEQNYVKFQDPNTTWEDLNTMNSDWWFARYPFDAYIFLEAPGIPDETIQAEWERLKDEQGIDLGAPIKPVEAVTSTTGTVGLRQEFQKGEIHLHKGKAYSFYGPILEHYRKLGGAQCNGLYPPISQIQAVTSSSNTEGKMMEFEGLGPPHHLPSVIYASEKGVGMVEGWIGRVYKEHGGYSGWLGFPLSDMQYHPDSTIQIFENGYIVYYYPKVKGERDWSREPVAYPYLASRGALFDVHAEQFWQDTGVQVQSGDRVAIIQVGGAWTHWGPGEESYDANGYANLGLQENATLPSAITGSLISRIGEDDGHIFSVGRWSVFTSPVEGTLYLAMNDNVYEDNAGFITVQIVVEHSD